MLKKQLEEHYSVMGVELDKKDFLFFNDQELKSISSKEFKQVVDNPMNNYNAILVDVNDSNEIENIGENYFALGAEREFRGQVFNQIIDITIHSVWTMAKIKEYNRIIKLMDYVNEGDPIKITLESNSDGRHIDSLEPIRIDDRILTAV